MKKFQIEKVNHSYIGTLVHKCCIVDYYADSKQLIQLNYSCEYFARKEKMSYTVGMWKPKQQKLNH